MVEKTALVTGCTGQDGSYLCELLLEKGYRVHGLVRRSSSINTPRIDHILDRLHLHYGDVTDQAGVMRLVLETEPDEIYNLAAMSHVRVSFDSPSYAVSSIVDGTLGALEAARLLHKRKPVRVYTAASSEMFGAAPPPQSETTPFHPRSPYACAKVFAFHQTRNYREAYGMFCANGILMNHESERRGPTFVTRKITMAANRIKAGLQDKLYLGNLDAKRDWGYAPEYAYGMWLMLQHSEPDDFVLATGETHSVREFLDEAFGCLNLDWREHVVIDERYYRPAEVDILCGDASKARRVLGWEPKVTFRELVRVMVRGDMVHP